MLLSPANINSITNTIIVCVFLIHFVDYDWYVFMYRLTVVHCTNIHEVYAYNKFVLVRSIFHVTKMMKMKFCFILITIWFYGTFGKSTSYIVVK